MASYRSELVRGGLEASSGGGTWPHFRLGSSFDSELDVHNSWGAANPQLDADSGLMGLSPLLLFNAAVVTLVLMAAGIVGNTLTVVALLRCPRVRNVAAAFIISLCVADCLFCITVLPFSASGFLHGYWAHGSRLCTIVPLIRYGNVGVSLLSIAMITINRYIMIGHYSWYQRIYRPIWIGLMILFCWAFSFSMLLPTYFGVWGRFDQEDKLLTCSILRDNAGRTSKEALFIIAFVCPCLVIVLCYARIFWVVHSSESRLRKHAAQSNVNRTGKEKRDAKTKRNEWRITKMVLAIFLSFLVCYLPITIIKVYDGEVKYPKLHLGAYMLLYLSACINPIIYVIMNKQYRQAYKTVLMCSRPRFLSTFVAPGSSYGAEDNKCIDNSRTMVSQVSIVLKPLSPNPL